MVVGFVWWFDGFGFILFFFYGGLVVCGKNVVDVTLDDAGLTGADVADNKDLEKVLSLDLAVFVASWCLYVLLIKGFGPEVNI